MCNRVVFRVNNVQCIILDLNGNSTMNLYRNRNFNKLIKGFILFKFQTGGGAKEIRFYNNNSTIKITW